jgi:predicted RNA-binding protein with EMAP domain
MTNVTNDISNTIRAKGIIDGAVTLTDAAEELRYFADYLVKLERGGIQLTSPIEDDYGFIGGPGVEVDGGDNE